MRRICSSLYNQFNRRAIEIENNVMFAKARFAGRRISIYHCDFYAAFLFQLERSHTVSGYDVANINAQVRAAAGIEVTGHLVRESLRLRRLGRDQRESQASKQQRNCFLNHWERSKLVVLLRSCFSFDLNVAGCCVDVQQRVHHQ